MIYPQCQLKYRTINKHSSRYILAINIESSPKKNFVAFYIYNFAVNIQKNGKQKVTTITTLTTFTLFVYILPLTFCF